MVVPSLLLARDLRVSADDPDLHDPDLHRRPRRMRQAARESFRVRGIGRGNDDPSVVCGQSLLGAAALEVDFAPDSPGAGLLTVCLHMSCFGVWNSERKSVEEPIGRS